MNRFLRWLRSLPSIKQELRVTVAAVSAEPWVMVEIHEDRGFERVVTRFTGSPEQVRAAQAAYFTAPESAASGRR